MTAAEITAFALQVGTSIAFLVLSAAGLAVIFGMMRIINLAHGELIMLGAYGTAFASHHGVPLVLAMLVGIALATAVGVVLERLFVRHLYGRPFDAIIVTWGIGLILSQGMLVLAGPSMPGIATPLASIDVGAYSFSAYRLLMIPAAVTVVGGLYIVFKSTAFGREARATMQLPDIADAIGIDVRRVYAVTFGIGAALAGLTGALFAPTMSIVPTMGSGFVVQAFATVIVGGADVFLGVAPAAILLGTVQAGLTAAAGTLTGVLGLLVAVIVTVRILPRGISSLIERIRP